jgi:hypothetical protein
MNVLGLFLEDHRKRLGETHFLFSDKKNDWQLIGYQVKMSLVKEGLQNLRFPG